MDPVLLHVFKSDSLRGWNQCYVSVKYDGWRMIWDPKTSKCYTRHGTELAVSDQILSELVRVSPVDVLDGELWGGYGTQSSDITAGKGVTFMVFDCPNINGSYSDRYKYLSDNFSGKSERVIVVNQELIKVTTESVPCLSKMMDDEVSRGGEGIVIRNPNAMYEFGTRSNNVIKMKPNDVIEVTVKDYFECNPITTYTKSLICCTDSDFSDDGRILTFKVSFKRTDPPLIGTRISIKYSQLTVNGLPKFPALLSQSKIKKETKELVKPKLVFHVNFNLTVPVSLPKQVSLPKPKPQQETLRKKSTTNFVGIFTSALLDIEKIILLNGQYLMYDNGKGKFYKITAPSQGGRLYCSCEAWKYQKLPASERTCKHCQLINDGWSC